MSFSERVKVYIDVISDKAAASVGSFKSEVSQAEGATGKLKAGAKNLGSQLGGLASSTAGTVAIIGTAVKVGLDAAESFAALAKRSKDLGTATGLSTEAASRWIAVGNDYGVTADQLQSGIGKIAKTLDDTKWEKYGIATHDAAGKARDANAILVDSLVKLSGIQNATERARVGTELFGKGWANLAPLLGHTRSEYDKMLSSVNSGQVITEQEAKKGEKWELAQKKLNDALTDFKMRIGEVIVKLAPLIDGLAGSIGWVGKLDDAIQKLTGGAFGLFDGVVGDLIGALEGTDPAGSIAEDAFKGVGDSASTAADDVQTLSDQFSDLLKNFSSADAWDTVKNNFDDVAQKAVESWDAAAKGEPDAARKARDYDKALRDLKESVIKYADSVGNVPKETVTKIMAEVDSGDLAAAQADFDKLTKPETKVIYVNEQYSGTPTSAAPRKGGKVKIPPYASGTSDAPGGLSLVGEEGPELVNLPRHAQVHTASATRRMLGTSHNTIHVYLPSQTPESLMAALDRFNRRNGLS